MNRITTEALGPVSYKPDTIRSFGANGVGIVSFDGGVTWSLVATGVGATLTGMTYSVADGIVVGGIPIIRTGIVLRTSGGGFVVDTLGAKQFLSGIARVDASTLVAGSDDGNVMRSTDNGANWSPVDVGFTPVLMGIKPLVRVVAAFGQTVYAAGSAYSRLSKSVDGGATWTEIHSHESVVSAVLDPIYGIIGMTVAFFDGVCVDANTAVFVGGSLILRTTDGGASFTAQSPLNAININGVCAVGTTLYAVSAHGEILKSVDAGATWVVQVSVLMILNKIAFKDASNGAATGYNGVVLLTNDGGATWRSAFDDVLLPVQQAVTITPTSTVTTTKGGKGGRK